MNLIGSALYDPSSAVTNKATSSLLAMTAFDTTNLRLAITVPAHGKVRFKMRCIVTGATTCPTVLLGVLNGATVVGRVAPQYENATANATTQNFVLDAEFTVTGLTPGAMNVDAAYAVQVVVASTNIKYGGPNTNAGANAWGGFLFEAWDPQPIPTVAAGAAGGLQIAGSNAATTYATLTVTGATTLTGNVALADGLTIAAPSTGNRAGLDIAGNGSGAAMKLTGGGTGQGALIAGGGTSGDGIKVTTTSGHGLNLAPVGTSMHGLFATGGNGGTSDGIKAAAGTGGVDFRANQTGNLSGTVATLTTYTGNTPQTGDVYALANGTSGFVATKADTAAIKIQTDKLTFTVAGYLDVNAYKWVGGTIPAVNVTGVPLVDDKYLLGTIYSTPATAGIQDINVKNINNVSASAVTTIKAVQGLTTADTIATYTGNTVQTGDSFARIGVAGVGLTNLGDTRIANLDATISSRTKPADTQAAVTTVTNLTNAPSAGDFTATMKTSIGTAVAASAVASVTGNVGGNVTGSVGSVVGAVGSVTGNVGGSVASVTTVSDKTGYALSAGGVQAIWDALASAMTTVGSTGKRIADYLTGDAYVRLGAPAGASTAADIAAIQAKTTNLPAAPASTTNITAGTITTATNLTNAPTSGDLTATMKSSVTTAATAATPTAAAVTGNVGGNVVGSVASVVGAVGSVAGLTASNLDATITSRASAASLTTVGTAVTAIKAKTDSLAFTVAGKVDSNILNINSIAVTGIGTLANPWGP